MIDLAALITLRAVRDHGSVSMAATALGYTPSAVSQQVKRLERQAGLPLLERLGRGVILTPAGRELVVAGSVLLTDLERIEADLHRTASTVAGHLEVAAFSTAMRGLVAPAIRDLLTAHPDLSVRLTECEPWPTIDNVASGQVDVGLVHSWGDVPLAIPQHVQAVEMARDVADVLVPATHRLATRKRISPADVLDEGWIATPEGSICRQWLTRMYLGTGRLPQIAHVSMEFDSHIALVRAGLGIALVPRLGRTPLPDGVVAVAAHEPTPTRTVTALHRDSMAGSPAIAALLEALRTDR
jgi:DNA-binding transcriptional LysR family regulator